MKPSKPKGSLGLGAVQMFQTITGVYIPDRYIGMGIEKWGYASAKPKTGSVQLELTI